MYYSAIIKLIKSGNGDKRQLQHWIKYFFHLLLGFEERVEQRGPRILEIWFSLESTF